MPSWVKRRFGLHARPVAVHWSITWWLPRLVFLALTAVGVAGLVWLSWQGGLVAHSAENWEAAMAKLAAQNAELERSNAALKSEVAVLERQIQIERATHTDLARQVKDLGDENAQLRHDSTLVQAISAADAKVEGVKVTSVRVEPNGVPGEYSYRIVLLQTGSRSKQFVGRYDLVINVVHNGEQVGITVPRAAEAADPHYQLDFRMHRRIEGTFKVPPSAEVRSVQLRVFEGRRTQPKVMQTVKLP
jgi:cell division protein FtsB